MVSHALWLSALFGEAKQKRLRICLKSHPTDIVLSLLNSNPSAMAEGVKPSDAEPGGWQIEVTYAASPDDLIFKKVLSSETEANQVFSDLIKATAEVEGLLRQEKIEEASKATDQLLTKFGANSSNLPSVNNPE